MPSKKRKYNARFPAGRIKKIMQTDEEVGKVAQAVPIIISRTLELFVESLLGKALQVTSARNAKTLSPSHVKQCILAEARFDFLRDLVKNIPDVSAAEEKELLSEESSPNSSRLTDAAAPPRRIAREDSNSSSSCDVIRVPQIPAHVSSSSELKRALTAETEMTCKTMKTDLGTPGTSINIEPAALMNIPPILGPILTSQSEPPLTPINIEPLMSSDTAIDLTKKDPKQVRTANFYQETLIADNVPHRSVIKINPIYTTPQPSTSYTNLNPVEPVRKIDIKPNPAFERHSSLPRTPVTPITPVINIDFSKNFANPEIKVLDVVATATSVSAPKATSVSAPKATSVSASKATSVSASKATSVSAPKATSVSASKATSVSAPKATSVSAPKATSVSAPKATSVSASKATSVSASKATSVSALKATSVSAPKNQTKTKHVSRQNSKSKIEVKKVEIKPVSQPIPVDIDSLNSGNLQIDEDYDT